jgi:hypothetical protein
MSGLTQHFTVRKSLRRLALWLRLWSRQFSWLLSPLPRSRASLGARNDGLCIYRRLRSHKDLLRRRAIGSFLFMGVWRVQLALVKPLDLIMTGESVHRLNRSATGSRGTDDDFAPNFSEFLEAAEQSAVRIALTFDAHFHAVEGDEDARDVHANKNLFDLCVRISAFQQLIDLLYAGTLALFGNTSHGNQASHRAFFLDDV